MKVRPRLLAILLCGLAVCGPAPTRAEGTKLDEPSRYFGIQIIDEKTGRGVPLVELKTVSGLRFWTDSAGWVAIDDPTYMGRRVFFNISSDGYEFPADGFGIRGTAVEVAAGKTVVLKIKRINIAERLYRITGEGIYTESVRLGRPVPIHQPLLNAEVVGQDSTHAVEYGGKIHWFWGDTLRLSYPLGHFGTAGAVSDKPGKGGLDPARGINLTYFIDEPGFSRPMLKKDGAHPKWLDGVTTVAAGDAGHPVVQLVGVASCMADVGTVLSRELVMYDEATDRLVRKVDVPVNAPLFLRGHPFVARDGGIDYLYFGDVYPNMRVKADLSHVCDLAAYQGFTCLTQGATYRKENPTLDRDAEGKLQWGWKAGTPPLEYGEQQELLKSGRMKADESPFALRDEQGDTSIDAHRGSVCWNEYRKCYVMIAVQRGGKSSFLGEVWYAEAAAPQGPWKSARKIATHNRYSFYNPVHHGFFDQDGGRVIYFEGTYTTTFSRTGDVTPRYEYNQMMYRLDLADERLR